MIRKQILINFILMIFILSNINIASANSPAGYYFESTDTYQFRYGQIPNMSYLVNNSYYVKNSTAVPILDTNKAYVFENIDGSFTFNNTRFFKNAYSGSIDFKDIILIFNSSNNSNFLPSNWILSNTTIISEDAKVNFEIENIGNYDLKNLNLKGINSITLGAQPEYIAYYGDIYNVSIYNSTNGLLIHDKIGGFVKDIYLQNMTRQSIDFINASNVLATNITIVDGGDYHNPATYVGFLFRGGHDNTIKNIYVDKSAWSGVDLTESEFNTTLENIYVNNAGHNGVDFHSEWNCSITNVTVNGSVAENFLIAGNDLYYEPNNYSKVNWSPDGTERATHTITINDYTSYNSTGSALSANRMYYLTVNNLTSDNNGGGILLNYITNATIINANIYNNSGSSITLGGTGRARAIDVSIIDSFFSTYAWLLETNNTRFINSFYPEVRWQTGNNAEYTNNYYLDLLLKDSNEKLITDATIVINSNNTNFSSMNGFGKNKQTFLITNNGHTSLPNQNRENTPVISEYYKNYPEGEYLRFSHTVTITTQNDHTVTLTGITPDSSWYRADPDVPAYTITAVIPDANSVPDITGFAPAESNPFNVGEVKKFRVWSDESLDKMDWYVDGALVASGSLSYAWTVASGGHTIEFRGSNNGGSVSQRWEVNGGSSVVLPSISESFPLDSSPVQLNGSTYEFSVSTDQPMTSDEWLLDGVVVATGAQTYTHTWAHASTHVLTYTGSNENGAVSQSWTVEVLDNTNDAGQSPDNSTGQSNPALISDPHIVYGHITDTDGAGVSGLTVTITTSQEQLSEVTDSEGRYDVVLSSYLDGETVTVSANDADFNGMNTGIVNYNAGSTTVDVTVSRFEDFTYQFQQGWNMFSTPLINDTMDAASFSALSPGIKYVVDYATGKAYINGFSSPGDNFAINPDRGYLVYMTAGDSVIISGTRPSGVRIVQLEQGYNLVGWTSMAHSTVTSAFVEPLAGKVKYVTKRDSDFSGYQTYIVGFSGPDEDFAVVPGGAYYVYVNEPCTLSYTAR